LEYGLYLVIFILGVILIVISYHSHDFVQDLFLNLGSNMAVITIVFFFSKIFSERSRVPPELRGKLSELASPRPGSVERGYRDGNSGNG
jgi:hypothetical protein